MLSCLTIISIGLFSSCEKNSTEKLIDQIQGQWIAESGTMANGETVLIPHSDHTSYGAEYQDNQITIYNIQDGLSISIEVQGTTSTPDADQIIYDIHELEGYQVTIEMTEENKLKMQITKDGKLLGSYIFIRGSFKTNTLLEKIQGQWVAVELQQVGKDPVSFPHPDGLSMSIEIRNKEAILFETHNGHITGRDKSEYTEDIDKEELIFRYRGENENLQVKISLEADQLYFKGYDNGKHILTYIFKRGTFSK